MIEFDETAFSPVVYTQLTLNSLMKNMGATITLDIAPNHTGIVCWDGNAFTEYYFHLSDSDKKNPHWTYLLRREFKDRLREIVQGKTYDYCLVEDTYGGENYITVLELITLNNVIDELMFEGVCKINTFYRMKATEWMAKARQIYKQAGSLKSKVETQGLLEYLSCGYYLSNKNLTDVTKKDVCFEDICDAYGMQVALAAMCKVSKTENQNKLDRIKFSDIKLLYVEHLEDCTKSRDKRIKTEVKEQVALRKNIQSSILDIVEHATEDKVYYAELPVDKLGAFGMKHKFTFYASGKGYLIFYVKTKKK